MVEKFKLRGISYEINLTDDLSITRTIGNYRIEIIDENTTKITIYSKMSGKEYISAISKISHHLLNRGDITGKELQNFEDELMDIWMFKNFGYTE
jgi:hypothetical protein